jgi:hypothetical protein
MKSRRIMHLCLLATVIATLAVVSPASAWEVGYGGGHNEITYQAFYNLSVPSPWSRSSVTDAADDPDHWGYLDYCGIHMASRMPACTAMYATPYSLYSGDKVSSVEFGDAMHFLEDAGQPFHAEYWYTDEHKAFEWYAWYYLNNNCNGVRGAMQTTPARAVPNSLGLFGDVKAHVQSLVDYAASKYTRLQALAVKSKLQPTTNNSALMICGQWVPWTANRWGINEGVLTGAERSELQSITRDLLVTVSSYGKGLLAIEGARNKALEP